MGAKHVKIDESWKEDSEIDDSDKSRESLYDSKK